MKKNQFTVGDLQKEIDRLIPPKFSYQEDNAGLIIGLKSWKIKNCIFVVNCTRKVLEESITSDVNVIIAKNIPFFTDVDWTFKKFLSSDLYCNLFSKKIAIIKLSNALEVMPGGISDILPKKLAVRKIRPLEVTRNKAFCRIDADIDSKELSSAMSIAMKTSEVTDLEFSVLKGNSKYLKISKSSDVISDVHFEKMLKNNDEIARLEICCESELSGKIVTNLDTCLKEKISNINIVELSKSDKNCGFGRVCELPRKTAIKDLIVMISKLLEIKGFRYVQSNSDKIKRIAFLINTQANFNLLRQAKNYGASCILISNINEEEILYAYEIGLSLIIVDNFMITKSVLKNIKETLVKNLPELVIIDSLNDFELVNWM